MQVGWFVSLSLGTTSSVHACDPATLITMILYMCCMFHSRIHIVDVNIGARRCVLNAACQP